MKRECTKAVILAAGAGTRVRSIATGRPKSLMDLAGRPIIEWVLGALAEARIRDVVMVTGFGARYLKQALGSGRRFGLSITYVHNRRWKLPNGLSLYAARRAIKADETFLLLMSDHLLQAGIIRKVAKARTPKCVLAVDTCITNVFDIHDATKVRLVGGRAVAIGKRLHTYNAVDCGLFRFDKRVFRALERAQQEGRQTLTDGVKNLIADDDLDVLPVEDMFWIDIDTPRAYKQAARTLGTVASTAESRRKAK